jgi:hypothetical protein
MATGAEPDHSGPSGSIIAVAAVQFLGSLAALVPPGLVWASETQLQRLNPRNYQSQPTAFYVVLIAFPIGLSLLGIITSIGMFRLRQWARRLTLFFSTVPALVCALFLILHHPRAVHEAIFVVGDLSNVFAGCLLAILAPISIWWWVLLTRKGVRSQFQ